MANFNPRTREGCDFDDSCHFFCRTRISIHAPVKGATLFFSTYDERPAIFQSTHP